MSIRQILAQKELKTRAVDNHGHKYLVRMKYQGELESSPDLSYKWLLQIEGTPGTWYLSTLLESWPFARHVTLDYGQVWHWLNPNEVMHEVLEKI